MTRVRTWWTIAETAAAALSTPRVDVGRADADVERLVRGSWLWRAGASLAAKLSAAWIDSRCRRIAGAAARNRP